MLNPVHSIRLAAPLLALLLSLPAVAGQIAGTPEEPQEPIGAPAAPSVSPVPMLCPSTQLDQQGRLVAHCEVTDETADYAVRVYESPFDTGPTDWLTSRELFERLNLEQVIAAAAAGVSSMNQEIGALLREVETVESDLVAEFRALGADAQERGPLFYLLLGLAGFVAVFGGLTGWVLWRWRRRRARRLNARRRTATALMGELVAIRDALRDLALDARPGRLDALEHVAAMRDAYVKNHPYLRLLEAGMAGQIIGFYGELRDLPRPYVEERTGKLGTHRVLRLEAAQQFAGQAEALASRAGQLAGVLRQWLEANLPHDAARHPRR